MKRATMKHGNKAEEEEDSGNGFSAMQIDSPPIQLFIKGFEGHTLTLQSDPRAKVSAVKAQLTDKTGVPVAVQQLCFGGKVLQDTLTLQTYQIAHNSTLFFSVRPPTDVYCDEHQLEYTNATSSVRCFLCLRSAITKRHFYCAKLFIEKYPSRLNDPTNLSTNPLALASQENYVELVEWMLSFKELKNPIVQHAFFTSIKHNRVQCTFAILKKYPGLINVLDENLNTPLHLAAAGGAFECLQLLLKQGCSVTAVNHEGDTPLHSSMRGSSPSHILVSYTLIQHGADASYPNNNAVTPLDLYDYTVPIVKEKEHLSLSEKTPSSHSPSRRRRDTPPGKSTLTLSSQHIEHHPTQVAMGSAGMDLAVMLNNPHFSDVTFSFPKGGQKIHAHKAILCARSTYFHSMFVGQMKESKTHHAAIELEDIDHNLFFSLVEYLYCNRFSAEHNANALLELILLAEQFLLDGLISQCVQRLQKCLTPENLPHVFSKVLSFPLCETRFPMLLRVCADELLVHWSDLISRNMHKYISAEILHRAFQYRTQEPSKANNRRSDKSEDEEEEEAAYPEEEVLVVMQHANVSRSVAIQALHGSGGDVVNAIMALTI